MSRTRQSLLAVVILLAASLLPQGTPAAAAATFTDDFDGPAGSAVDGGKWVQETGNNSGNNHELQWYTAGAANAALDGQGHLVITAKRENIGQNCWNGPCQYTSARMNTAGRFTQAYGRFEARIQIPRGQGMWPAFWMLGDNIGQVGWPNSGEVDIMENVGFEPGTVHGTIHGPGYSGAGGIGAGYTLPGGAAFADGFHTFAVDWSPNRIAWSVDGNVYSTKTSADINGNQWVFDHPFFIILNLAVGGDWPGNPDGSTVFPQRMVIDYVHVTDTSSSGGGGRITGPGGKCVDVAAANTANGTPIQLYDCNGTNAQAWTRSGNTLQALGKCMDVTAANAANGTKVQLYDCNGTNAQSWTVGSDGTIRALGKCLDLPAGNTANGTQLQIWDCNGGPNQKWTVG
ncbi:glycoside hydrolase family 16 protein [Fodinicola acaciae]|uniref:glycoside hydrolase family 16 protein n=1 Tax=Fodinicola acaciae TaxID=2681555 RepID=UPI0013CF5FAC|nr:glycoside hydrolase family 16 protein [Fodinicola acaciae]